jgi:hypothetical protein
MEFQEFPKIARLSREVIVTEKIDGTNAQIMVVELEGFPLLVEGFLWQAGGLALFAGSRTKWITPECDNHGFARWAYDHRQELMGLGPGRHFGEWWGAGIQRGYGLPKGEKRFSLFNTIRWCLSDQEPQRIETGDPRIEKYQQRLPACCHLVPVLCRSLFDNVDFDEILRQLSIAGSAASPGFMNPEGIVAYHVAGNVAFKKTLGNDGHKTVKPKKEAP